MVSLELCIAGGERSALTHLGDLAAQGAALLPHALRSYLTRQAVSSIRLLPRGERGFCSLNRFEEFDEVRLLLLAQSDLEVTVVVIDHVHQRGEAAVVVIATLVNLLVVPQR